MKGFVQDVVMLMHGAVSFISLVFVAPAATGAFLLMSLLVRATTMWLLVAALVIAGRRQLTRESLTRRAA